MIQRPTLVRVRQGGHHPHHEQRLLQEVLLRRCEGRMILECRRNVSHRCSGWSGDRQDRCGRARGVAMERGLDRPHTAHVREFGRGVRVVRCRTSSPRSGEGITPPVGPYRRDESCLLAPPTRTRQLWPGCAGPRYARCLGPAADPPEAESSSRNVYMDGFTMM
jgi:hypothetical protein